MERAAVYHYYVNLIWDSLIGYGCVLWMIAEYCFSTYVELYMIYISFSNWFSEVP